MTRTLKEEALWKRAEHGAKILTSGGDVISGRITWVSDHTVGFLPAVTTPVVLLEKLGMKLDTEALLFKGFIRTMTPEQLRGSDGRQAKARSQDSVR